MSNRVWDKISYAQSEKPEPALDELVAQRLIKLLDENERLKQHLAEAAIRLIDMERKLTELKAR